MLMRAWDVTLIAMPLTFFRLAERTAPWPWATWVQW